MNKSLFGFHYFDNYGFDNMASVFVYFVFEIRIFFLFLLLRLQNWNSHSIHIVFKVEVNSIDIIWLELFAFSLLKDTEFQKWNDVGFELILFHIHDLHDLSVRYLFALVEDHK